MDAAHEGHIDAFYIIGGNFLDTMPDPAYAKKALENVPLRIHQDLILNSSMFADPKEAVLLFPGQTRYEQKGGGTATSTERRIRYSPEISGPRIGEAHSEWEIIRNLSKYVLTPEKQKFLDYSDADAIRQEIDRVIPLYEGIKLLKKETDSIQYGGTRILVDGFCTNLPDSRARFSITVPENEVLKPGEFLLTTRRGKQFNSIVFGNDDPMVNSRRRDEIFLSSKDASMLNVKDGDPILLKSETGEFQGVCKIAPVHPGTVQGFWPETNVLISRRIDPHSHEPDYNTVVTIQRI
jgi:predicted molibdopterin-dependent oxidoreductase YjgC